MNMRNVQPATPAGGAADVHFPEPVPVPRDLEAYRATMLVAGFDEVLEREWAPLTVVGTHTHPFDAEAVLVRGEMWLTVGGQTRHLEPGGRFSLVRETLHAERYGPAGAAYWVARRNPRA